MTNTKAKQITSMAKGAGINMVGKMLGRAMHIAGQILLARWLGPALFGLYAIGWNLVRVMATILPLGMDIGVLERGGEFWPEQRRKAGHLAFGAVWLTFGISMIAGALLFGGANWLALQFNKPDLGLVFRLFALVLPLASGLKVAASASRISQQMRYGILSEEIVQPVLNLCLIGLFFILGLGIKGAIWASTLSFGVGLLLAFIHLRTLFAGDMGKIRLDLGLSKTLLSRSAPIAAATIFTTLMLLVDRILVGYFLSESEAGIYQAISIFAVFFITILSALKIMAAPMVSTAFHRGDLAELRQLFHLSTRWGLYLTLPVAGVLLAASEQSIQLLFGAEYSAGGLALTWLILAQVANMISGPVEFFLIMTGHSARWVAITAAMLVANLSLNWVLIPRLGILGAAVATLVSFGGTSLLATVSVRRLIGIWPFSRGYGKIAIAAAVMSLGLWVFLGAELTDPLVVLLNFAALACLGFFGTLILLGLEPEERQLLQQAAIRIGLRR